MRRAAMPPGAYFNVNSSVFFCFLLRGKWIASAAKQDDRG